MDIDQPSEKRVGNVQRTLVTAGRKATTVWKFRKELTATVFVLLFAVPGLARAQYAFTTIDVPKATRTAANGNSTNQIVGEFDDEDENTHGFVLKNGVFTTIDFPNAPVTSLNGINASGQLMGTYFDTTTGTLSAFVRDKGDFTKLDPFDFGIRSQGGFINAKGEAVGTYRDTHQKRHGFIWRKGTFTTFNVPEDHPVFGTVAQGINDVGQIVGNFVEKFGDNTHRRGFLRSSKGDFTRFDMPGMDFTSPSGINNAGQIVGFYADNADPDFLFHGFVLSNGVFTTVDVPGARETQINSINAKGEIVGAYIDTDGVQHGFLGTPVR